MPKPMLIGLTGYKQVGKDTTAEYLCKYYDFQRRAFADKLKEAVANLLGIPLEDVDSYKADGRFRVGIVRTDFFGGPALVLREFTWREFLQRFGTEMGRKTFHEDFWINLLFSRPFYKNTVISDCRFPNELRTVKEHGGKVVQIVRPGYEPDGHASELPPPDHLVDYVLPNDGDTIELFSRVEVMMTELFNIEPVTA